MESKDPAKAVILLGPPGAGKGTQCERIAKALRVPKISSGDILRQNIRDGSEIGNQAEEFVKRGSLIPDALICEVVFQRIAEPDCENGFIVDGFPRTRRQAEILDSCLAALSPHENVRPIQTVVIRLVVNSLALLKRLSGRRICPTCGSVYNVHAQPPQEPGVCDLDGSRLEMRDDDREGTVHKRLTIYQEQTLAVAEHYSRRGKVLKIDGDRPPDIVTAEMLTFIGRPVSDTRKYTPKSTVTSE